MIEVIMPRLGLTMEEGNIVRWLKAEGEEVVKGETLLEVETDKVVVEVEAPASGTLGKIATFEGETVPVSQVIAYIVAPGEETPKSWPLPKQGVELPSAKPAAVVGKVRATPVARRTARDRGVDLNLLEGTGEGGMITKEDVLDFLEKKPVVERFTTVGRIKASPRARRLAEEKGVDLAQVDGTGPGDRITEKDVLDFAATEEELITPNPVRRMTAQRMVQSFTSAPHFYLTVEAVATRLVALRERLLPIVQEKKSVRLTFTDILIVLLAKVLRQHPLANASWEEGKIRIRKAINIGLATAVEQGLIVPVIKNADQKEILQTAQERKDLVGRATRGELSLEELEGGTFTLTNLGMFGVDELGPIINPPQSAILGVGRIAERAVVEDGQVVARPTIRLTLSVDHRVLDGIEGAKFLSDLKAIIEQPEW